MIIDEIDNHIKPEHRLFIDYRYQSINWHRLSSIDRLIFWSSVSSIVHTLNEGKSRLTPRNIVAAIFRHWGCSAGIKDVQRFRDLIKKCSISKPIWYNSYRQKWEMYVTKTTNCDIAERDSRKTDSFGKLWKERKLKVIPLKLFYYQTFFETWRDEHSWYEHCKNAIKIWGYRACLRVSRLSKWGIFTGCPLKAWITFIQD